MSEGVECDGVCAGIVHLVVCGWGRSCFACCESCPVVVGVALVGVLSDAAVLQPFVSLGCKFHGLWAGLVGPICLESACVCAGMVHSMVCGDGWVCFACCRGYTVVVGVASVGVLSDAAVLQASVALG